MNSKDEIDLENISFCHEWERQDGYIICKHCLQVRVAQ